MEVRLLTVYLTVFISFGDVFSSEGRSYHTGSGDGLAFRNLSMNHRSRFPLYMMHLYRSFRVAGSSAEAASTVTTHSDNPSVQSSDSVLSLTARSE